MRKQRPCATLQEIGDKFGITRERVRQILKRAELKTRRLWPGPPMVTVECYQCHKLFPKLEYYVYLHEHDFCSWECAGRYKGLHQSESTKRKSVLSKTGRNFLLRDKMSEIASMVNAGKSLWRIAHELGYTPAALYRKRAEIEKLVGHPVKRVRYHDPS
jgi:DNA-binding CsgD family transcriptional regulator